MAACQSFFQCLLKSICIFMYIWMSCSSLSIVSVLLFKIPHTHWMLRTGQSLWLMQELMGTYGECIAELNWESTGVNNTLCQIIFDSFKDKIYRPIDNNIIKDLWVWKIVLMKIDFIRTIYISYFFFFYQKVVFFNGHNKNTLKQNMTKMHHLNATTRHNDIIIITNKSAMHAV